MRETKRRTGRAAVIALLALTAAFTAAVTMTVLQNAGPGPSADEPGAGFGGTYRIDERTMLSILPDAGGDEDEKGTVFYLYTMTEDPDDDEMEVLSSGPAKRRGEGCIILYEGKEALASVFCSEEGWYFQRIGGEEEEGLPLRIGKIDDEAVVPE